MTEGELNVDDIISRLLEGKCSLHVGFRCYRNRTSIFDKRSSEMENVPSAETLNIKEL